MTDPRGTAGSMSLLVDMTAAALDPSYAAAAARRAGGEPRPRLAFSRRVVAAVLLVGLATGVAGAQVKRRADEVSTTRHGLLADVRAQTAVTDRLAVQADQLRAAVGKARARALGADARGRAAADAVAALELATGAVAVTGPGIVVTLTDAGSTSTNGNGRGGQVGDGRVFDRDVQDIVNALWAAGAEAISVNDQRVTAQTAIRSAGEAILVDLRPLTPPYAVRAIGDLAQLEPAFVDSATARRFQTWTSLYGMGFDVRRAITLRLPAAGAPDLRLARAQGAP